MRDGILLAEDPPTSLIQAHHLLVSDYQCSLPSPHSSQLPKIRNIRIFKAQICLISIMLIKIIMQIKRIFGHMLLRVVRMLLALLNSFQPTFRACFSLPLLNLQTLEDVFLKLCKIQEEGNSSGYGEQVVVQTVNPSCIQQKVTFWVLCMHKQHASGVPWGEGGLGACSHRKILKFTTSETVSGGFRDCFWYLSYFQWPLLACVCYNIDHIHLY